MPVARALSVICFQWFGDACRCRRCAQRGGGEVVDHPLDDGDVDHLVGLGPRVGGLDVDPEAMTGCGIGDPGGVVVRVLGPGCRRSCRRSSTPRPHRCTGGTRACPTGRCLPRVGAVHAEGVVGLHLLHPAELLTQARVVFERHASVDAEDGERSRRGECLAALWVGDVVAGTVAAPCGVTPSATVATATNTAASAGVVQALGFQVCQSESRNNAIAAELPPVHARGCTCARPACSGRRAASEPHEVQSNRG